MQAGEDALVPVAPARDDELAAPKEEGRAVGRAEADGDGGEPLLVIKRVGHQQGQRGEVDGLVGVDLARAHNVVYGRLGVLPVRGDRARGERGVDTLGHLLRPKGASASRGARLLFF